MRVTWKTRAEIEKETPIIPCPQTQSRRSFPLPPTLVDDFEQL